MIKKIHEDQHGQIFCDHLNEKYEIVIASHGEKCTKEIKSLFFDRGYVKKVKVHETHGTNLWDVDNGLSDPRGCDGLWTKKAYTALTIYAADCLPVMLWAENDEKKPILLAIHCGWRSLANGIVEVALQNIIKKSKINSKKIKAILCPCIGKCCYNVREDFLQAFQPTMTKHQLDIHHYVSSSEKGSFFFDLAKVCEDFLLQNGLQKQFIFTSNRCTKCYSTYRSFRRDGIKKQNFSFIFTQMVDNAKNK